MNLYLTWSQHFFSCIKIPFKVIYDTIHSKTFELLRESLLYILNTPGKLLEKAQKKSWKALDKLDFLHYKSARTLDLILVIVVYKLAKIQICHVVNLSFRWNCEIC